MATGGTFILGKDNFAETLTTLNRRERQANRGSHALALVNFNPYGNGLLTYPAPGGAGVTAYSWSGGPGVKAYTDSGIAFYGETSDPGPGTFGIGVCGVSKSGVAVWGEAGDTTNGFAGIFNGILRVNGDLEVYGAKSAVVPVQDGSMRRVYSIESPESWLEDFGEGQLRRGRATVTIDRRFAALIRGGYHVFLTPYGDCNGLYVSRRRSGAFDVREQGGGTHTLAFGYRLVGTRKDVKAERLAKARPNPKLERPARDPASERRGKSVPRPR